MCDDVNARKKRHSIPKGGGELFLCSHNKICNDSLSKQSQLETNIVVMTKQML